MCCLPPNTGHVIIPLLDNCYSRAYLRIIYVKNKGSGSPHGLVPILGKQNILEIRVSLKLACLGGGGGGTQKMSGMEEGGELKSKLCNWGGRVSTTKHKS